MLKYVKMFLYNDGLYPFCELDWKGRRSTVSRFDLVFWNSGVSLVISWSRITALWFSVEDGLKVALRMSTYWSCLVVDGSRLWQKGVPLQHERIMVLV